MPSDLKILIRCEVALFAIRRLNFLLTCPPGWLIKLNPKLLQRLK